MRALLQAVAQLGQRCVGLLLDQFPQAGVLGRGKLGKPAAAGFGGDAAGFTASLHEPSDEGGADAEDLGDVGADGAGLLAGPDEPFPQVD